MKITNPIWGSLLLAPWPPPPPPITISDSLSSSPIHGRHYLLRLTCPTPSLPLQSTLRCFPLSLSIQRPATPFPASVLARQALPPFPMSAAVNRRLVGVFGDESPTLQTLWIGVVFLIKKMVEFIRSRRGVDFMKV